MMVRVRISVFVILDYGFELFRAEVTVECCKGCGYFGLEGLLASHYVLLDCKSL